MNKHITLTTVDGYLVSLDPDTIVLIQETEDDECEKVTEVHISWPVEPKVCVRDSLSDIHDKLNIVGTQ